MTMGNFTLFQKGIILLKSITVVPSVILFLISQHKNLILSDVKAWSKYRNFVDEKQLFKSLLILLILQPEFQSQFKMRLGGIGRFSLLGGG